MFVFFNLGACIYQSLKVTWNTINTVNFVKVILIDVCPYDDIDNANTAV